MRNSKTSLSPPPTLLDSGLPYQWTSWFEEIHQRLGYGVFAFRGYNKANLPDPRSWYSGKQGDSFTGMILVTDDSGGPTLAFSNGSNWLRIRDNVVIS